MNIFPLESQVFLIGEDQVKYHHKVFEKEESMDPKELIFKIY